MRRVPCCLFLLLTSCLPAAADSAASVSQANLASRVSARSVVLWVQDDGRVLASGEADSGRGDGGEDDRSWFEPIEGLNDIVAVAQSWSSNDLSAALDRHGQVWLWGRKACNVQQSADCDARNYQPFVLETSNDVAAIALGDSHLMTLHSDGRVMTAAIDYGGNEYGQQGLGNTEAREMLSAVPGIEDAVAIAAGDSTSLILRGNGTVWGMGLGYFGELGPDAKRGGLLDGLDERSANVSPRRIAGLNNIVAISAGHGFAAALDSEGRVWGWGSNESGQLGLPASDLVAVAPRALRGFTSSRSISAGYDFLLSVDDRGVMQAQGGNVYGTLGDRRGELEGELRSIAAPADVHAISAGHYNAFAQTVDGSVLGWGANEASVGGFAPQAERAAIAPTALSATARVAAPSALVSAGGVELRLGSELEYGEVSQDIELTIDGQAPIRFEIDLKNSLVEHRVELPPGRHHYRLSGRTRWEDDGEFEVQGEGVLLVGETTLEARYRAALDEGGIPAAIASMQREFAIDDAASIRPPRMDSVTKISTAELDRAEAEWSAKLPASYRKALQRHGAFALYAGSSPFPQIALLAPATAPTLADWIKQLRREVRDEARDDREDSYRMSLQYYKELLGAQDDAAWRSERIGALLGESTYMLALSTACPDGRSAERLEDFFSPDMDSDTGEETPFGWRTRTSCGVGIDLARAVEDAVFEFLEWQYTDRGVISLSHNAKGKPWSASLELVPDGGDGKPGTARYRLSGGSWRETEPR